MNNHYPEQLVKDITRYYLPEYQIFFNYRPNWLKNIGTNKNLEIDIYIPQIKLCVEINGIHHKTEWQMKKDKLKKSIIQKKGLRLTNIDKISQIDAYIRKWMIPNSDIKIISDTIKKEIADTEEYYKHNSNNKYFQKYGLIIKKEKAIRLAEEAQQKENESVRKILRVKEQIQSLQRNGAL